jgi:hypothetical protein
MSKQLNQFSAMMLLFSSFFSIGPAYGTPEVNLDVVIESGDCIEKQGKQSKGKICLQKTHQFLK